MCMCTVYTSFWLLLPRTQHIRAFRDIRSDIKHYQCETFKKPAAHLFFSICQSIEVALKYARKQRKTALRVNGRKGSTRVYHKRGQSEENTYNEKLELKESFNGLKVLKQLSNLYEQPCKHGAHSISFPLTLLYLVTHSSVRCIHSNYVDTVQEQ